MELLKGLQEFPFKRHFVGGKNWYFLKGDIRVFSRSQIFMLERVFRVSFMCSMILSRECSIGCFLISARRSNTKNLKLAHSFPEFKSIVWVSSFQTILESDPIEFNADGFEFRTQFFCSFINNGKNAKNSHSQKTYVGVAF